LLLLVGAVWSLAAAETNPAAIPAVPNFSPGQEYADGARMFQGVPGIERAVDGRLWATWYSGGVTENEHNYVLLYTSGDDGASWRQALALDPDLAGPVRAFDPCLWLDPAGKLWLFWAQEMTLPKGRDPASFVTFAITTADSGKADAKWSAPRQIARGVMMNKPIADKDGRWLLPISTWGAEGSARVVVSTDQGATFSELGAANIPDLKSRNADEHMIVGRKDGSLWMLVRGKFPPVKTDYNGLGESVSTDGGKTWSAVAASPIPHPGTRFFIRRLAGGRLLLVRNDPPGGKKDRSHLTAFLSEDDGNTWKGGLVLDERNRVSYPDGAQSPDGRIYVIYDRERGGPASAKEILMAVFTEEDVLAGKPILPKSRLRVRINQATGIDPAASAKKTDPNTGGPALRGGTPAEIESGARETDTLRPGVKLFLNRNYTANEVPEVLRGHTFIRANLGNIHATCSKPGLIYIVTPSTGRDPLSREQDLLDRGFQKVDLPEFRLLGGALCSIFQKELKADEPLDLRAWGVMVLP